MCTLRIEPYQNQSDAYPKNDPVLHIVTKAIELAHHTTHTTQMQLNDALNNISKDLAILQERILGLANQKSIPADDFHGFGD